MRLYRGIRTPEGCIVTVNGDELDPRLDLWNHSPTGFEWGYGGSGPAQLALAILADALQDDGAAIRYHQRFKFSNVGTFPHESWNISDKQVREWLHAVQTPADLDDEWPDGDTNETRASS